MEGTPLGFLRQVTKLSLHHSSPTKPYWSSGVWNGKRFSSSPEVSRNVGYLSFVETNHEKYHTYHVSDEMNIYYNLGVSGQINVFIWPEGSQDWVPIPNLDLNAMCMQPVDLSQYAMMMLCLIALV